MFVKCLSMFVVRVRSCEDLWPGISRHHLISDAELIAASWAARCIQFAVGLMRVVVWALLGAFCAAAPKDVCHDLPNIFRTIS